MPNRFGQVWASTVEAASVAAGDVYFLAGSEYQTSTPGSTSYTSASSVSNVVASGTPWSNYANALTDDGNNASASIGDYATSDYLYLSDFGFSIPTNAVVTDVNLELDSTCTDSWSLKASLRYDTGGSDVSGVEYTGTTGGTFESWGLWGRSSAQITATRVNSSVFGVRFQMDTYDSGVSATGTVDYAKLQIEYTVPGDYYSAPLLVRALGAEIGFINAAGSGESEDAYIPVDILVGDYNTSTALTLAGTTSPVIKNIATSTMPQLYKGSYSQVVNAQVKKRVYVNPRYPLNLDLFGLEKFTGNNGTTRVAGTDIPFVGLHFPTAVSKALKLTLLSES